jgi:hypothetical protein
MALALLVGCGGGGAGVSPTGGNVGSNGIASFSIAIPAAAASANALRPAYVSTNAVSMTLAITPGSPGGTTINETVSLTGSNCSAPSGARTCQVSVTLLVGAYTASISMFGPGNVLLSQGQNLSFSVAGGQTTPVTLTLDAVPASVQVIVPATMVGSVLNGFTVYQASTLTVNVLDATGATIVGPGSPTISVTSGNPAFTIASSGAGYTIVPPSAPAGTAPTAAQITVTVTQAGASSPAVTQAFSASNHPQTLFVTNQTGNTVQAYALPYASGANPVATMNALRGMVRPDAGPLGSVTTPTRMGLNKVNDLFVGEFGNSTITEFAPPYTGVPIVFGTAGGTPVNGAQWVTSDSAGKVFVTNYFSTQVLEFNPPYTAASTAAFVLSTGVSGPQSLVLDASSNLFVGNYGTGTVTMYTQPFLGAGSTPPSASFLNPSNSVNLHPWGMTLDAAGDLWVAWEFFGVSATTAIAEYTPPFTPNQTPAVTITNGILSPYSVAVVKTPGAFQGYMFAANNSGAGNGGVLMFVPPVTSSSTGTALTGTMNPVALYTDPQGDLYVANSGNNTITVYAPPYTSANNPVATISTGISGPFGLITTP